jgi:hypothetical protein
LLRPRYAPRYVFWLRPPGYARRFARFRARQLGSVPVGLRPRFCIPVFGPVFFVPVGLRPRLAAFASRAPSPSCRLFCASRAPSSSCRLCQSGSVPVLPPFASRGFWLRPRFLPVGLRPRLAAFASRAPSPSCRRLPPSPSCRRLPVGLRPRLAVLVLPPFASRDHPIGGSPTRACHQVGAALAMMEERILVSAVSCIRRHPVFGCLRFLDDKRGISSKPKLIGRVKSLQFSRGVATKNCP